MRRSIGMKPRLFRHYLDRYRGSIYGFAHRVAAGDADLEEDLIQEGVIKLWCVDLSEVRGDEDPFIRRVVFCAMLKFYRRYAGRRLDERFVRFPARAA